MFDPTSRYAKLAVKTHQVPDPDRPGETRSIRFVERRLPQASEEGVTLLEHTVEEGDRLDNLTAKYLGDPLQFWRLADANLALRPESLTDTPGRQVKIKQPR